MKRILGFLIMLSLTAPCGAYAQSAAAGESAEGMDVGNKFCPLSGDKAKPKFTSVYNGKRYSFCCKMCVRDFEKNPEKYLKELAEVESGKAPAHVKPMHH